MFRVDVVGDGGLNKTGGGREEGRKGREGFVQDRCGWQREPEQNGGQHPMQMKYKCNTNLY